MTNPSKHRPSTLAEHNNNLARREPASISEALFLCIAIGSPNASPVFSVDPGHTVSSLRTAVGRRLRPALEKRNADESRLLLFAVGLEDRSRESAARRTSASKHNNNPRTHQPLSQPATDDHLALIKNLAKTAPTFTVAQVCAALPFVTLLTHDQQLGQLSTAVASSEHHTQQLHIVIAIADDAHPPDALPSIELTRAIAKEASRGRRNSRRSIAENSDFITSASFVGKLRRKKTTDDTRSTKSSIKSVRTISQPGHVEAHSARSASILDALTQSNVNKPAAERDTLVATKTSTITTTTTLPLSKLEDFLAGNNPDRVETTQTTTVWTDVSRSNSADLGGTSHENRFGALYKRTTIEVNTIHASNDTLYKSVATTNFTTPLNSDIVKLDQSYDSQPHSFADSVSRTGPVIEELDDDTDIQTTDVHQSPHLSDRNETNKTARSTQSYSSLMHRFGSLYKRSAESLYRLSNRDESIDYADDASRAGSVAGGWSIDIADRESVHYKIKRTSVAESHASFSNSAFDSIFRRGKSKTNAPSLRSFRPEVVNVRPLDSLRVLNLEDGKPAMHPRQISHAKDEDDYGTGGCFSCFGFRRKKNK
ncbi:hypothetical protein BJ741DRAFT_624770 [Chytriomyces cf. hyalinus JEL632]|nr:hypothetical protein BJ741DRAFT_624770 [Chytriomyces cf. hyalinus JEL632]